MTIFISKANMSFQPFDNHSAFYRILYFFVSLAGGTVMNGFLISTSCKGRCLHLGSISFKSTNNKVFVHGKPLILSLKNPISDNLMITNCNFKVGSAPHPCISTKWKKYSKKILENGHNIIMNEFFGSVYLEIASMIRLFLILIRQ